MKQFKNLDITGPDEQLFAFIDVVSENLPFCWRRDRELEAQWESDSQFAFIYEAKDGDPPSRVFLTHENGKLSVPNIAPQEPGWLSVSQYNQILDEFAGILRNHRPQDRSLKINVTSDVAAITDWVSPEAAELLDRFSNGANKSTGSSHPSDFQRWADFLIKVHEEGSSFRLSTDFLAQWLEEELGWSSDRATKLAFEYEFARDLLRAYDSYK